MSENNKYRDLCIQHWTLMCDEELYKDMDPKRAALHSMGYETDETMPPSICFACEYNHKTVGKLTCKGCPVKWTEDGTCESDGSPYNKWSYDQTAANAKKVLDVIKKTWKEEPVKEAKPAVPFRDDMNQYEALGYSQRYGVPVRSKAWVSTAYYYTVSPEGVITNEAKRTVSVSVTGTTDKYQTWVKPVEYVDVHKAVVMLVEGKHMRHKHMSDGEYMYNDSSCMYRRKANGMRVLQIGRAHV